MSVNEPQKSAMAPETLEGWAVLHQVFRMQQASWNLLPSRDQRRLTSDAVNYLRQAAQPPQGDTAIFSLLGHKGDLLLLHFRPTFDELNEVELGFSRLGLSEHLAITDSYLSYVELGLYELTAKLHEQFLNDQLEPDSEVWKEKWQAEMAAQKERVSARLYLPMPDDRYLCFYPMNKKRGESVNWYQVPMEERQHMMRDHGMVGRRYAGRVKQIITGSIGFDDWEWGVYLFAEDPAVYKKLIYEMRFDEASALYAEFGPFLIGLRFALEDLPQVFSGRLPGWNNGR